MKKNIAAARKTLPLDRAYVVSVVIKSFKGRRNVEVHLYRPTWKRSEEDSCNWELILGGSLQGKESDLSKSRKVVMESFTEEERDILVDYLEGRYSAKLAAINSMPLSFPVPPGLNPLSGMPENENLGRIRFDQIPNYPLSFAVHGVYDLSMHSPILTSEEV
ncbi:hypothetical protein [Desulfonatronovibrio hydrogenovorans]|uniref:hypothetical protein n=1 Tax=Desulfonatronovibrio hydrogenovorans TaxID=53245 RepID=UPI00048A47B7|nr:hypothetical protein [Desulfonatronovibrio hydrogenovorans]